MSLPSRFNVHTIYVYNGRALYVLVITSLRGMLPVYRPVTRGRVAPEGGGPINRNLPIRDVIIDL